MRRATGAALLPYHAGRITTYVFLGAVASGLALELSRFFKSDTVQGLFLLMGALLFFLQFLGIKLPSVPLPSLPRVLQQAVTYLSRNPHGMGGYVMGLILGFLPCGLLLSALLIAAAAPGPVYAGLGMLVFGLATAPALSITYATGHKLLSLRPGWVAPLRRGFLLASSITLLLLAGGHFL